jgi:BirA family biotin operon repressor/biotin-[acetyl-CoA-carboxylase] ligase
VSLPGPAPTPDRPPLRRPELPAGGLWSSVELVAETGSTNADVAAAARSGAAEGLVVVAEHQHAGRGRAGRSWSAPPRAGLAVSVLLRPGESGRGWPAVDPARWGWLPLLAGVALAGSVTRVARLPAALAAGLKWPNDLLLGGAKCAGILAEVVERTRADGGGVVVGIGLNVTERRPELPPEATSLALAGAGCADRDALLRALLADLAGWYGRWRAAGGDASGSGLADTYRSYCITLGRQVRVRLPGGGELAGTADTVDPEGRLVLRTGNGTGVRVLAAGDIVHLRGA